MNKHEEYLKEIQKELNKSWGNQPKSWWNIRLNTIRNEHEATEKAYEELQRDVKRYFELNKIGVVGTLDEHMKLYEKLSKVGEK